VPGFDPARSAAFETFVVDDVRAWVRSRFDVDLAPARTAIWGASLGGELALALGLRHPDVFGAIFCLSPGGGYQPGGALPSPLPRAYLGGGTGEQWFLDNATRWADALRAAGGDVELVARAGGHGDAFWYEELPPMVAWAFGG
jgi:enterochelin esterase-like enzyme